MDYQALLKSHRKKPLFTPDSLAQKVDYGRPDIVRIIPQREPILYVDSITGVDIEQGAIAGSRLIPDNDPVFHGHFPDYPVYPGSYTLEMIGQLSLCLYYFLENDRASIARDAVPVAARATRVLGALFLEPIPPGAEITLLAKKIDYDGYFARAVGQALIGSKVCCVSAGEVCIL